MIFLLTINIELLIDKMLSMLLIIISGLSSLINN